MVEFRAVESRTLPIRLQDGEKLVIRVWRWDADRLVKDAEDDYEIESALNGVPPPYFSVSVFALARSDGETQDELVDRLRLHAAEHRSFKWYCLVTESELSDQHFELILHEPPDDHYDIALGRESLDRDRVEQLAVLFGDEKIRMRT